MVNIDKLKDSVAQKQTQLEERDSQLQGLKGDHEEPTTVLEIKLS